MAANSYYGPGSSYTPQPEQEIGWKPNHPPVSPPPSYAGHFVPPEQVYGQQQQQQPPPLQVYQQGFPPQGVDPRVYEQHGQGQAYYAPSPSPGPQKHKKDHKHGKHNGSGEGKYPRPGGANTQQVVYVEDGRRKKTNKDDVALGFCAGCAAACCCCGCVVM